jgi:hypothetical protein
MLRNKLTARRDARTDGGLEANLEPSMSEESRDNKCPMGNRPWLATFLVVSFLLVVLATKLGWL